MLATFAERARYRVLSEMEEELLKVSEVAERLRVAESTVRGWITRGEVRAIRLPGGVYRIPRAEVERLLSQGLGES
jgi:excisionase family DNA binding protein